MNKEEIGNQLYKWAADLFPINRSITGKGVRQTLHYIKEIIPELIIKSVPTGTKVFDWEVPEEWDVTEAYIITPEGNKIADFNKNNLHLMGYSIPINKKVTLEELQPHLFSLAETPKAIPYVTSYYNKDWGFCISHELRKTLKEGLYHVVIKSSLTKGDRKSVV